MFRSLWQGEVTRRRLVEWSRVSPSAPDIPRSNTFQKVLAWPLDIKPATTVTGAWYAIHTIWSSTVG